MTVANLGTMYAGDTLVVNFTVQQPTRQAQDLTDCTIRWAVARDRCSGPVLTKTVGSGITVLNAAQGRCQAKISKGELTEPGQYLHELEVTLPNGDSYTYATGPLVVRPAILA